MVCLDKDEGDAQLVSVVHICFQMRNIWIIIIIITFFIDNIIILLLLLL